ncbi:hypothetical protein [Kineococcus sp. SYSU DK002]|uniref:hypothetical protein n=1 Tax=Kineococcus sp. SYSU DK002 TaxID=3383123 RepID=UPI003D7EF952
MIALRTGPRSVPTEIDDARVDATGEMRTVTSTAPSRTVHGVLPFTVLPSTVLSNQDEHP